MRNDSVPALVVLITVVMAACGTTEKKAATPSQPSKVAGAAGRQGGIWRQSMSEPISIDPALSSEANGARVVDQLFVGLTTFDDNPDLAMKPGVAERWSASADCTQWTFNLRRSKFSNGEDVTSESFIRGMTRVADGRAASTVAAHLSEIQGYDPLHGTATSPPTATTFSGLSAPDPQTLVVRLSAADCEFDKQTLHWAYYPVPLVAGAVNDKAYGEAPVGNGPFMIKPGTKWEHDKGISLVRNESYFGPQPHLDGIEFVIFPSQAPAGAVYQAFQAGELDTAAPPSGQWKQAESAYGADGGFIKGFPYQASFFLPNVTKGPLKDPDARRAVSLSIDRAAVSQALSEGYGAPADALVPATFGAFHQPGVCDVCHFDPTKAKELAVKAGLAPGTHLRFLSSGPIGQAYKDQMEKNLGIVVDLESLPGAENQAKLARGDFELTTESYIADYPTPDAILSPVLAKGSSENFSGYDSAEFNSLIQQARSQKSDAERRRLYQAAERLAIGRDVALMPSRLVPSIMVYDAKKWTGVELDFFGHGLWYSKISLR